MFARTLATSRSCVVSSLRSTQRVTCQPRSALFAATASAPAPRSARQFHTSRYVYSEKPEAETKAKEEATVEKTEENTEKAEVDVEKLQKEIKSLQEELETVTEQSNTWKDKYIRALAECENIRKIGEREIATAKKYAVTEFAKELLVVNDNIILALENTPQEAIQNNRDVKTLYEGVSMTKDALTRAFKSQDIEEVYPLNQPFDPNYHNAMFVVPWTEGAVPGNCSQVITRGYTLKGRVIRSANVGVISQKPKEAPAAEEQPKE